MVGLVLIMLGGAACESLQNDAEEIDAKDNQRDCESFE